MENYYPSKRVDNPIEEDEIRVGSKTDVDRCINAAIYHLKKKERIRITGLSGAIPNVILVAQGVKGAVGFLHQLNTLSVRSIEENYEPRVEGLDPIKKTRRADFLTITLQNAPLDQKEVGY